jgi:hypothetical protein
VKKTEFSEDYHALQPQTPGALVKMPNAFEHSLKKGRNLKHFPNPLFFCSGIIHFTATII